MCNSILTRPSYFCITVLVIFQLVVAVALTLGLVTRFYIYKTQVYVDMPNDMRVVGRESSAAFCSSHRLTSSLIDTWLGGTSKKNLATNSQPEFDLYILQHNPEDGNLTAEPPFSIAGAGQMRHGLFEYNTFYLMKGSKLGVSLCTNYIRTIPAFPVIENNDGLMVYIIKGEKMFLDYVDMVRAEQLPCKADCPPSIQIKPNTTCTSPGEIVLNTTIHETDQYYVFILDIDKSQVQAYTVEYHIQRFAYDVSRAIKNVKHTTTYNNYKARNDEWLVVEFRYKWDQPGLHLYNIQLDYSCHSNMLVYLGIFFFAPLGLIVLVVVVLSCCQKSDPSRRELSVEGDQESRGLLNSHGYGSNAATHR